MGNNCARCVDDCTAAETNLAREVTEMSQPWPISERRSRNRLMNSMQSYAPRSQLSQVEVIEAILDR